MINKNITLILLSLLLNNNSKAQKLPKIPKVFSLQDSLLPVKDQGDRDACASFAFTAMIEYDLKKETGFRYNLSEEYLTYYLKQNRVKNEYTIIGDCYDIALVYGFVQEAEWAYQNSYFNIGFPCQNELKNDTSAPYFCYAHQTPNQSFQKKLIKPSFKPYFRTVYEKHDLYDICKYIYKNKITYIICLPTEAFNNAWENNGIIQYLDTFSEEAYDSLPKHFAVVVGYDLNNEVFIVKNSWGKEYGNKGYGTVSFNQFLNSNCNSFLFYLKFNINHKKLPKPLQPISLKVNHFKPSFEIQDDKSIKLKLDASIDSLGTKRIEFRARIIKITTKDDSSKTRSLIYHSSKEIKEFKIDYVGINKTYLADSFSYHLNLNEQLFDNFYISKEMLLSESFRKALNDPKSEFEIEFFLICTDDENYEKIYGSKSFSIDKSLF